MDTVVVQSNILHSIEANLSFSILFQIIFTVIICLMLADVSKKINKLRGGSDEDNCN